MCLLGKRVPIANPLIGVVDFVIEFFEALDRFVENTNVILAQSLKTLKKLLAGQQEISVVR